MQSQIRGAHECLGEKRERERVCLLHFWQNGRAATAVTQGGTETEIRVCTDGCPGEENSPAPPAGTRTRDLSIMSPSL